MKVYISADLEGVSGVVATPQTRMGEKEYERARQLMTAEVNAAIEGVLAGGAAEVIVNDAHGTNRNILIEELNPAAQLITGKPKLHNMMQGLDSSFDVVFLLGYHAQPGTAYAILDHAYYSQVVYQISLNGQAVGEAGFNAALAGYFGVPVVLVTGDQAVAQEARELLGSVETVIVKEAYGRSAASCLIPSVARQRIADAARRVLQKQHEEKSKPFVITPPITLTVEFMRSSHADLAELIPGSRRVGGRYLEYRHDDFSIIFRVCRAMLILASAGE